MSSYNDDFVAEHADGLGGEANDFPFEEIFEWFGEGVPEETKHLAFVLAAAALREVFLYCLPSKFTPRCERLVGKKFIAAVYVVNDALLTGDMNALQVKRRFGLTEPEIERAKAGKELDDVARILLSAADRAKVPQISAPSLRQFCKRLGFNAVNISPFAAEFSRQFSMRNRAQGHDWRSNAESQPNHQPETETNNGEPSGSPETEEVGDG